MKYMIGAVWVYSGISGFIARETGLSDPLQLKETPIGISSSRTDFELAVPGLLILSIIMLMLSAHQQWFTNQRIKLLEDLKFHRSQLRNYWEVYHLSSCL